MNSRPIGGTDTGTIQRISAIVVEAPKPCPLDRCVISDNKCVNPPATDPPATDPPVTDPPTPPSIASSTILSLDPITVASVNATATLPVNTSTTATVDAQIGELCLHLTATAPACPEDIVLMSSTSTQLAFNPITITSQDEETVSFTISNPFGVNLFALYYEYAAAETGSTKCYEESPLAPCHKPIEVTAHCMSSPDHPSIAVVDIWFVDSSAIDVTAKDTVPQCCQPDEEDALLPSMLFSFKIYCDSKCVLPK